MNPAMPTEPGTPGLVFASRHEILYDPPWTLFHKVQNTKRAVWLYQGEYESVLSGTMTAEQFRGQRSEVKREWGDLLMTQVVCKPYLSMRSRIALRKAGLIPLEDKMAEKVLIDKEMLAVKSKGGHPVDADDIIAALERGDEVQVLHHLSPAAAHIFLQGIDILRMTCVKYDHAFAKELEERLPTLPRLTEEAKKKAEETAKKASNKRKKPTVSVGLTSRTKKKKMATQRRMSKKSPPLETDEDSSADDFVGRGDNETATTSSSVREFRPRKSTSQPFVSLVTDEEIEGGNSDDSDIMDLDFRY
ncbi:hypothetical protein NLJ89_g4787 [Agrocybe chaxingu]|uniref:DUF6697 domain-containing protein n=1 Tax=Agrocybe chaxingu TaxID=84603 RepID=A0A9W8MVM3_9AGAR|nr:hypothetical protein NLJ89_g4787 [Agrocybe chaxingu]